MTPQHLLEEVLAQLREPGRRKSEILRFVEQYGQQEQPVASGPLFQFVLVKAGDPFPLQNGYYSFVEHILDLSNITNHKFETGEANGLDLYILRPFTPPTREESLNSK